MDSDAAWLSLGKLIFHIRFHFKWKLGIQSHEKMKSGGQLLTANEQNKVDPQDWMWFREISMKNKTYQKR